MKKKYRALLINPWIYDVAAHDFWTKPIGLLYLASLMDQAGVKIDLIDCLDRFDPELKELSGIKIPKGKKQGTGKYIREPLPKPAGFGKLNRQFSRYGLPINLVQKKINRLQKPDVVLITSSMTYWYPAVFDCIKLCKSRFPDVPVILGGIYATLFYEHARQYSGADLVIQGEGEPQLFAAITKFIPNFDYFWNGDHLDDIPFPAYHQYRTCRSLPVLTSRGCPFRCSFCASKLLQPIFRRRSVESVLSELKFFHKTKQVRHFAFYDDALLVDPHRHIEPILQGVLDTKLRFHFHTPNGLHPRFIDANLARLMIQSGFDTIRLSFETAEAKHEDSIDHKVTPAHLSNAVDALDQAGFPRKNIEVYLLTGLPNQTIQQTFSDMLLVHGLGVKIRLAQFSPIPGTKDWKNTVEHGMDQNIDPIYTNNSFFALQWGEDYHQQQQKLHLLARVLNYAVDLNLPLTGSSSIVKELGLDQLLL